ncbi:DNA polymerase [Nitrosopumilus ureiphilus]|uniref:DNA polymerase n=1 Tax=Nitrosopumilus ureiphilus TaxID=1470067 RepID=UPI001FE2F715|nr:DNA polymerase [Nitrosopumilus ureiphilus]
MIPTSNAKTLDGIRMRKQNRNLNSSKDPRYVVGIDTETENGDIFLIADSDGNYLDGKITFDGIAEFLFRHEYEWIFFYNLSYDAECILKLLPEEILIQYKWKKELRFQYKKYKIHYIDRKKLTISKGNHSISCYDIAQYYDNKSLDVASESVGLSLDQEYLDLKKNRKIFSKFYYSRNKRQIRAYCIKDCRLTKELSEYWIGIFETVFSFYPNNWISAGYLAEKVLINNDIPIPLFNELQYPIQEIARSSFYGGRFELIKRGYIGECYLYDLNSAYPYALTTMPDITQGKWFESKKIHPKSKIGFFFIEANISDKVKIAPFPFVKKNRTICYPSGKFKTYVTLDELLMVKGDPEINYKILDSWQFIPRNNCTYPFKNFIKKQYYKRLELKEENNPLEKAIKIVLNSIYGKMAQRTNNVIGNLFNPVIASYITGYTRRQLYEFTKKNKLDNFVVAYATDSVACQKKIKNLDSKKLGKMKLDKQADDVIFLSNGFYKFNGIWKNRGIGYDNERKIEIEHLETRVKKDGQLYIGVKSTRTTHIKSGILYNRLKKVGKIESYEKKIGLNSDKKRLWDSDLESLNSKMMCDSLPIPADLVGELIGKEDLEWYDDEKYEPESEL